MRLSHKVLTGLLLLAVAESVVSAQGTLEDYKRAVRVRSENHKLVFKTEVRPNWIGEAERFWYRNDLRDGRKQFIFVDPEKGKRRRAFNHKKLAEALSKARDGKTDVFGVLFRPSNLDPSKKYPVVENIYTGPHGFLTPKSFRAQHRSQTIAELGFVTVIIDGLGTAKRSKGFNIADHRK